MAEDSAWLCKPLTGPTVRAVDSGATLFNTAVSDIQTGLTVTGKNITGTLHLLTEGDIADYWGDGYFMALDFVNIPAGATVSVGMNPSYGGGMQELDEDHNGVWKITDKNNQTFKVVTTKDGLTVTDNYILSGLTLEE